jgi:hypothetical protein
MVVPRTPRPPIVAAKPPERRLDPNEIERWVARLVRAIRLKREEQLFLGAQREADTIADANRTLNPTDSDIGPQRR